MQLFDNPLKLSLTAQAKSAKTMNLAKAMFDEKRSTRMQFCFDDLYVDISRQLITPPIFNDLLEMANAANVQDSIAKMASGGLINCTEGRSVTHMDARSPETRSKDKTKKIEDFVEEIRKNKSIKSVVNIGIGGSSLGPSLVSSSLAPFSDGPDVYYVSNVDPAHLSDILIKCSPSSTLIIVTSKTFTTAETLQNAVLGKLWLLESNVTLDRRLVAITASPEKAVEWGISASNVFDFDEGIGGRYSVWSSVGLPVMLSIGIKRFKEFLKGAHDIDTHFISEPIESNIPIVLALIRVWNRNFLEFFAHGIIPYDERLKLFPSWVQQLEMESNGKQVDVNGKTLFLPSSPLIWGETGTNAQHSFFQYLHQGQDVIPIDILFPRSRLKSELKGDLELSHRMLIVNAVAQAEALAIGSPNIDEPHRNFSGGRPSTILTWAQSTPYAIGRLLALYENTTIACGFIWDLNSFDQWGVELGKNLANKLMQGESLEDFSPAARSLLFDK